MALSNKVAVQMFPGLFLTMPLRVPGTGDDALLRPRTLLSGWRWTVIFCC